MKILNLLIFILFISIPVIAQNNHGYESEVTRKLDNELQEQGWVFTEPIIEVLVNFNGIARELLFNIDLEPIHIGDTIYIGYKKVNFESYWIAQEGIRPMNELISLPLDQEDIEAISLDGIEYFSINSDFMYWFN